MQYKTQVININAASPSVADIRLNATTVRVFEKFEVKFSVNTASRYPMFQYDESPPSGVTPKIGVTVSGIFTANGKTWTQPAFYMTEVTTKGSGGAMYYEETPNSYWVIRFSPQEVGLYQVQISVKDSGGSTLVQAGTFNASTAVKKGFVQVSKEDSRYFEFSNGDLYWPIGPANGDPAQYKDTGINLDRSWLGGIGIYSSNWARWKSSAEQHGNEGNQTRFSWREKYPGHDLSYELFYPQGFLMWLTTWLDDDFGPRLESGKKYQVKFVVKTANITGPRISGQPYGLVIKTGSYPWGYSGADQFDTAARNYTRIVSHDLTNHDWKGIETTFTATSNTDQIYVYLDNVTGGQAYVDELSIKELRPDGTLGGEVVRNSRADQHTYVEQRPAAWIDELIQEAEANDVYYKFVVHDKNDWIQNHLLNNGQWADEGDGYYQAENTKARWLLRQWYRYLIARWGYSTAIHSWELNNEGPPNDDPAGSSTAPHWRTAQAFADYMHTINAHPQLATTSFWCCWRPKFWGNEVAFPDVDYADLHFYGNELEGFRPVDDNYDTALWTRNTSIHVYEQGYPAGQKGVGKPIMRAESGIPLDSAISASLTKQNNGHWYHDFLWGQLNYGAMSEPGYWFSEHLTQIPRVAISKAFYLFVKDLDLNKGGYIDAAATSSNSKLLIIGQKNLVKNKAHVWIRNADHSWSKAMQGLSSSQNGTVGIKLQANTDYIVQWWDTNTGTVKQQQMLRSNTSGDLNLAINSLSTDIAVKISSTSQLPSATPISTGNASGTRATMILMLHGIGKAGDNVSPGTSGNLNPLHSQRSITVEIFNSSNQLAATKQGIVTYQSASGAFSGSIQLDGVNSGTYTARIKILQYLRKSISGIMNITAGQSVNIAQLTLVTGDSNNDNRLSILDYNLLLDCFSDLAPARNCTNADKKLMTDLTDDGSVNQFDYNLFLRELSVQVGE